RQIPFRMSRVNPQPVIHRPVERDRLAHVLTDHLLVVRNHHGALPTLLWHEDEPIAHPSSIALNYVSRLASRHVKVVLTGEGSDESLGGYERYRNSLLNIRGSRAYRRFTGPMVREAVRRAIDALPVGATARRKALRSFLYLDADLDTLYFDNFAVFGRERQRELLAPELSADVAGIDPYAAAHRCMAASEGASLLQRFLYTDVKTYLHELLMKQDQMSMAASIESRVPFLDHQLLAFASALPDEFKIRGMTTKYILREAMRDHLPAAILSRKKMGFPVPVGRWFRGEYRGVVDDLVLGERAIARGLFRPDAVRRIAAGHASGRENHAQRLWSLANLELWHRIFVDGEDHARLVVADMPAAAVAA
ncbi:MAG: asparagine synthase-related protein, partial [Gemmatimonadaceae bacterium]